MKSVRRFSAVDQHGHLSQFGAEGLDDGFVGLVGVIVSAYGQNDIGRLVEALGLERIAA